MRLGGIVRISAPVLSFCLVCRLAIVLALREDWFDEQWVESCVSLDDAILDVRANINVFVYTVAGMSK